MAFNQIGDLENNAAFKTIFGTEKPATPLMPCLDDCMGAEGEETLKTVNGTAVALNDDRDNNALKTHPITGVS